MSTRLNRHLPNAPYLRVIVLFCLTGCLAWLCTGCGGGQSISGPALNPVPSVASISPNTASRGDSAFTLSVNGSNFLSTSTVKWNGSARTTSFVSPTQLTAQITADDIVVAQSYNVTVANPSPGGGTSTALPFDVPCVLAPLTPASSQTVTRLGSFYFDGWAGPLDSYHLKLLVNSPYQYVQPLSGWRDDNPCAVEQQLAWARSFGLNFFVYDWFYKAKQRSPTQNLNSALEITRTLPNHHGMQFAIMYTDDMPGAIAPADWNSATAEWLGYMSDRDYVRVNGKPLLIVYDMGVMHQVFGSSAAVVSAFDQLRKAAQAQGLPGVYIVGGFFACYDPNTHGLGAFSDLSIAATDGYDAVTLYGFGLCIVTGEQPFSLLLDANQWVWSQVVLTSPVPYMPLVVSGQDARANGTALTWSPRTPQDFVSFVNSVITLAESNPQLRPEPTPAPPLVVIGAWNELLEGSYIVPTVRDGTSYGDALAAMLATRTSSTRR
jgi:Glycosyltransferase WbsX